MTICTRDRQCLFGHVVNGDMRLNDAGEIAHHCWVDIPNHFPSVELDAFMVMPNHVHGIIVICGSCTGEEFFAPTCVSKTTTRPRSPSRTVGSMVLGSEIVIPCKGEASVPLHKSEEQPGSDASPLRQRGFHEHVVQNEAELTAIREYVLGNPARWDDDENNPVAAKR